jgi:hypothetical protein
LRNLYPERISLDDEKRLQKFEKQASTNPEIYAYECRIAPFGHGSNENNIVYASWKFHQYFNGLTTHPKTIPSLIVRPERTYKANSFVVRGQTIKRHRIDVLMDFTSEAGLNEIASTLNDGYEVLSPKGLRTYIHARDANMMCKLFTLKYAETAEQWAAASLDVPDLLTVEYNCSHQAPVIS